MKKKCKKCGVVKDPSEYTKDRRLRDGLYSTCKKCHYEKYSSEWRKKNTDKVRDYHRKWSTKNREKLREYVRRWKVTEGGINWMTNLKNRIDKNTTCSISMIVRKRRPGRKWQKATGHTVEELFAHLKSKFDDKMTFENYGSYWEIDHIIPKSAFKYQSEEDPEFKKCWSLDNLQPLEKSANRIKNTKLTSNP